MASIRTLDPKVSFLPTVNCHLAFALSIISVRSSLDSLLFVLVRLKTFGVGFVLGFHHQLPPTSLIRPLEELLH